MTVSILVWDMCYMNNVTQLDRIQRKLQNDQRMIQEMLHLEKDRKIHNLRKDWRDMFT